MKTLLEKEKMMPNTVTSFPTMFLNLLEKQNAF